MSCFLTLLAFEIIELISRESEEKSKDDGFVKTILLKRFKLNTEFQKGVLDTSKRH